MNPQPCAYVVIMSLNGIIKFSVISVWLIAMGWLIRFEAFPGFFDPTLQGYREMARHLPALRDSWMKVMSEGKQVGFINSSIEMTEVDGEEQLQMRTQLLMRIHFQGKLELMRLNNEVHLDARQMLTGSYSSFSMGPYAGSLSLVPGNGQDNFLMTVQFNDIHFKREVKLPASAVIASPLMDAGLRSVKVGQTLKIRSMDPFSLSGDLRTVEIRGLSMEERILPGTVEPVKVTTVAMKMGDLELHSEVDEYGRILRQETPFGFTFLKSEANEAMKIPRDQAFDPMTLLSGSQLSSFFKLPVGL